MNVIVTCQLREYSDELKLPRATAKELISFLTVKSIIGQKRGGDLSPSGKIDHLLHKVLLNTKTRKALEDLVGEIWHSDAPAELQDELKVERRRVAFPWESPKQLFLGKAAGRILTVHWICRLAAMNTMSKEGFEPNQAIWEEPATLMHTIVANAHMDVETGQQFKVYTVLKEGKGQRPFSTTSERNEVSLLKHLLHSA